MGSCSVLHFGKGRKHKGGLVTDTTKFVVTPIPDTALIAGRDTLTVPDTSGLMKQLVDMVLPIYNKRHQYTTFTGKAKVHFESPEDKQDFTANIRVKKDTAIWVDITALGGMFHVARVYVTNDSFFLINYKDKNGMRLALTEVARILPTQVDFMTLQNLMIGEPLRSGNIRDVATQGASWLLKVQDNNYMQSLEYRKADSLLIGNQVNTLSPNGPQAVLKYDHFEVINNRKVPASRTVTIQNGNDKYLLEMEMQNMEFDKQLEMPFTIPKGFPLK